MLNVPSKNINVPSKNVNVLSKSSMIHKDFPGGPLELQEYVMEVCDGIKDHLVRDPSDPTDNPDAVVRRSANHRDEADERQPPDREKGGEVPT